MTTQFRTGLLGTILCSCGIITEADVATALAEQKRTGVRFGEALVGLGIVMQEDIDWALSHQLDIPYVRIQPESVDPEAVALVPASVARRFKLLPLIKVGGELRVAMADPLNREAVDEVVRVSGCSVSVSMGLLREILEMQDLFYGGPGQDLLGFSSEHFPPDTLKGINEDTAGAVLIDALLMRMAGEGFASVTLKPADGAVKVVGRRPAGPGFSGELSPVHYGRLLSTLRGMSRLEQEDAVSSRHGLELDTAGGPVRFRALMLRTEGREYVTLERVPDTAFPADLESLGTDGETLAALRELIAEPSGLVVFAGPDAEARLRLTGLCLEGCERLGREVIAVGRGFLATGKRFTVVPAGRGGEMGEAVRAACAHAAPVVAAEELFAAPDFTAAMDGALGGRLVLAGINSPDVRSATGILGGITGRFPLLPAVLKGAAACRAVRTLCPDCKEEHRPSEEIARLVERPPSLYYRPAGCPACAGTGYSGVRYLVEAARTEAGAAAHVYRSIAEQAGVMLDAGDITPEEYLSITAGRGGV